MLWAGGGSRFGEANATLVAPGSARQTSSALSSLQFGNLLFERAIDLLHDPPLLINQGEIR